MCCPYSHTSKLKLQTTTIISCSCCVCCSMKFVMQGEIPQFKELFHQNVLLIILYFLKERSSEEEILTVFIIYTLEFFYSKYVSFSFLAVR